MLGSKILRFDGRKIRFISHVTRSLVTWYDIKCTIPYAVCTYTVFVCCLLIKEPRYNIIIICIYLFMCTRSYSITQRTVASVMLMTMVMARPSIYYTLPRSTSSPAHPNIFINFYPRTIMFTNPLYLFIASVLYSINVILKIIFIYLVHSKSSYGSWLCIQIIWELCKEQTLKAAIRNSGRSCCIM